MKILKSDEQYSNQSFHQSSWIDMSLSETEFEACDFIECDFSQSILSHFKWIECTFKRCNLSLIEIPDCRFLNVDFDDCKCVGINWVKANWPEFYPDPGLKFRQCILNDSSFFGLTLHESVFDQCRLHDVDFREADLAGASLTECDMTHSLFMHTNLEQADLTDTFNFNIDVLSNRLQGARFSRYDALNLLESLGIELID
jgi:uncharacterized protein YjbI with pentapeptide repeats